VVEPATPRVRESEKKLDISGADKRLKLKMRHQPPYGDNRCWPIMVVILYNVTGTEGVRSKHNCIGNGSAWGVGMQHRITERRFYTSDG
jgi:hypothetical protein